MRIDGILKEISDERVRLEAIVVGARDDTIAAVRQSEASITVVIDQSTKQSAASISDIVEQKHVQSQHHIDENARRHLERQLQREIEDHVSTVARRARELEEICSDGPARTRTLFSPLREYVSPPATALAGGHPTVAAQGRRSEPHDSGARTDAATAPPTTPCTPASMGSGGEASAEKWTLEYGIVGVCPHGDGCPSPRVLSSHVT